MAQDTKTPKPKQGGAEKPTASPSDYTGKEVVREGDTYHMRTINGFTIETRLK